MHLAKSTIAQVAATLAFQLGVDGGKDDGAWTLLGIFE